ncbi:50S ribosomal protein L22 [Mycoplasmopsis agassizii]|uniref:Large ribosomal subunit protein uL22 n=1 Tax=Mycoplasmopsis agassizii TaxID=33922 RepID=A0A1W1X302_9BACT|nr:50S ribosomal protein L22 [Mycoplasmopsis agassizii]PAF55402.1 50S ribosomal protein L22 [Mycoplasmopsis agassizii]PAK21661.1 50S ribosomal protein L22 [Mycoplasmopsis agassizii]SMC18284.1 large subunit ribosomal protein L22 [Mycoplasmopsis agassizii]
MEAYAKLLTTRISSQKANLVADLFRTKRVSEAIVILQNTNKKAAPLFLKLVNSAVANAVNNHGLDASKLVVSNVMVNQGPTLKRFQPHSQGRATRILKRTSHLAVTVKEI